MCSRNLVVRASVVFVFPGFVLEGGFALYPGFFASCECIWMVV